MSTFGYGNGAVISDCLLPSLKRRGRVVIDESEVAFDAREWERYNRHLGRRKNY